MIKRLWLVAMITLSLSPAQGISAAQGASAASENERTRIYKQDIIELMVQIGRMPVLQQSDKMDKIWKEQSRSKTPRSDFLFCMGYAYLGNYKAQAYLGYALENGRGIVEDLSEAYVWYSVALDHPAAEKEFIQKLQADTQRVKQKLQLSYPAPTDDDLDELVKAKKEQLVLYLAEIRNTKL
jgi:TPR repeat protein